MLDLHAVQKQEIGVSLFTDVHNNTRKVLHSRLFTEEEPSEVERRISEELYQIFARERR